MAADNLADAWLRFFSPTFNLPGSGSIGRFSYHPYTTWEATALFRGDGQVEQQVYREVASPGRQLGRLTEVVLELAAALAKLDRDIAASPNIAALQQMAQSVEGIKQNLRDDAGTAAREALEHLKATDEDEFRRLLRRYSVD